jgi:UDP-glucuronate 4-epimerase
MEQTILITGGAGFIGSNLADALIAQGIRVISLDNFDGFYPRSMKESNISSAQGSPLFTSIEGDIRDKETLETIFEKYPIDIVIHLAAKAGVRPSILRPVEYFDVNVNGTLNILETMKGHGVKKMIFASSSSVYGNNEKMPYSETDNVDHPISPYAASKKSCELITHTYHHLYDFNIINLRFFTVFGPRQRPDLAIHKFFKNIYTNTPIEMYGDGSTSRDYTYVADIISGIIGAIDHLRQHDHVYETINLGNHTPVKLSRLVEMIEDVTQKKIIIKNMPLQMGDVNITFADISKAQKLFDYHPRTPLRDGLVKFKNWYEKNK